MNNAGLNFVHQKTLLPRWFCCWWPRCMVYPVCNGNHQQIMRNFFRDAWVWRSESSRCLYIPKNIIYNQYPRKTHQAMCFDRGPLEQTAPNLHHLYTLTSTLLNNQNDNWEGFVQRVPIQKFILIPFRVSDMFIGVISIPCLFSNSTVKLYLSSLNRQEEKHRPTTSNMTVGSWTYALLKGISWHCFKLWTFVEEVQ